MEDALIVLEETLASETRDLFYKKNFDLHSLTLEQRDVDIYALKYLLSLTF